MAETPSTMLPLGTLLPPLRLPDVVTGEWFDAGAALRGRRGLLVAFVCNHCPFVKHIRREFVALAHEALDEEFAVAAVCSNDATLSPADGPEEMRRLALLEGWRFPYLLDDDQAAAKAFQAACTPDFFVFDAQRLLVYRGAFDASRPTNQEPVTGAHVRAALGALQLGHAPDFTQVPSIGCNIKWRPGNAPTYAG